MFSSDGTPEGVIAADKGSLSTDITNGDLYVKTTDTVNTGWKLLGNVWGAVTQHAVLAGGADNAIANIGPLTDGQIVIGSTSDAPVASTLTAGAGVTITNAAGSITLSVASGGFDWVVVTGTSDDIEASHGYQTTNAGMTTLTLPATMPLHGTFKVLCLGTGLVTIAQRAGQTIRFGAQQTTTGVGGSLVATNVGDALTIKCTEANTDFCIIDGAVGNWDAN